MKLAASYELPCPPERVYGALTNPAFLRPCIPGCDLLELERENEYWVSLSVGLPGLKGKYAGKTKLSELRPNESFRMSVEGKGGAGFVKGSATLRLVETETGTRVECEADAQVGGVLAAVGQRLVSAGAKQMMDSFFRCFASRLGPNE